MARVGIRELKARLSYYLAQVKEGEQIVVTDRGALIAVILPTAGSLEERLWQLVRLELASWDGGKPSGSPHPVTIRGKLLSETIMEDSQ